MRVFFSLVGTAIRVASSCDWRFTSEFYMYEDLKQDFEMAQVRHLLFKSKLRSALYGSGTDDEGAR